MKLTSEHEYIKRAYIDGHMSLNATKKQLDSFEENCPEEYGLFKDGFIETYIAESAEGIYDALEASSGYMTLMAETRMLVFKEYVKEKIAEIEDIEEAAGLRLEKMKKSTTEDIKFWAVFIIALTIMALVGADI